MGPGGLCSRRGTSPRGEARPMARPQASPPWDFRRPPVKEPQRHVGPPPGAPARPAFVAPGHPASLPYARSNFVSKNRRHLPRPICEIVCRYRRRGWLRRNRVRFRPGFPRAALPCGALNPTISRSAANEEPGRKPGSCGELDASGARRPGVFDGYGAGTFNAPRVLARRLPCPSPPLLPFLLRETI